MFTGVLVGLAVTVAAPAAAKDKPPEVLKRFGKWEANYDDDACHLAAQFGDAKDPVLMRLTAYELGDWFTLGLYGRRLSTTDVKSDAKVDFGLGAGPVEKETLNGTTGRYKAVWISSLRLDGWQRGSLEDTPPTITPEQSAAVTGVTVTIDRRKPIRLEAGSMAKPLAEFRKCQNELVKSWGYDPDVQAKLQRPARPADRAAPWLTSQDYPMGALQMRHNGLVQFRLDVDARGGVSGCHVLERSDPDEFADWTCKIVKRRAKLVPALDAQGQPVRSFIVQRVTWRVET